VTDSGLLVPTVMIVTVDRDWDVPVYIQVAGFIRARIESGELAPHRPIPSIRTLCQE